MLALDLVAIGNVIDRLDAEDLTARSVNVRDLHSRRVSVTPTEKALPSAVLWHVDALHCDSFFTLTKDGRILSRAELLPC